MSTELVRDLFSKVSRKVPAVLVAVVRDGGSEVVALGSVEDEPDASRLCWEIGSITKVMTGVLLADASLRGEVALDDPIGCHLPDSVAKRLPEPEDQPRLVDLSTHRGGFPRLPLRILRTAWRSDNPYSRLTEEDVFDCLGPRTHRPRRSRHRYSNFGVGLLGHLLAAASNRTYAGLVEERLLRPLGMPSTGVGSCGGDNQVVPGFRKEKPTPPWTMGALQGAGAIRSTMADMVTFANAIINPPSSPLGESLTVAATPVYPARGPRGGQGLGWMIRTRPGDQRADAIWHNGGTYGGSSFLAIDLAAKFAVIALGNSGPRMVPSLDGPSWKLFDSLHD